MSFRTWLYITTTGVAIVVIGALFWTSFSSFSTYKQGHSNERNYAAQYYANATQESAKTCGAIMGESGVFDWLTCLAENVGTDGSVKQAEYDLKAQQDMAAWAFGMLLVTIWLTVITLAGVLFVAWTLFATRKMATDAREIGESQTRAHILYGSSLTILGDPPSFSKLGAQTMDRVTNFGSSIASGVTGKIFVKIYTNHRYHDLEFDTCNGAYIQHGQTSSGKIGIKGDEISVSGDGDFRWVLDSHDVKAAVSTAIEFTDIFSSKYEVIGEYDAKISISPVKKGSTDDVVFYWCVSAECISQKTTKIRD